MFDERQKAARRRGAAAGFWSLLALLLLNLLISTKLGHPLFADQYTMTIALLFIVMLPMICYLILSGAYLKPGQHDGSLLGLAILALLWAAMTIQDLWWKVTLHYGDPLIVHGQITHAPLSAMLPVMNITWGLVAGYQWWRNRHPKAD